MASSIDILNVTNKPEFDDLLTSYKTIVHYPLASSTYGYNEEVRFHVENQNDFWLPSQSWITIEGQLNLNPAESAAVFCDNGALQLFSECKYFLNGIEVDRTRGLGITSTIKGYCTLAPDGILANHNSGWGDFSANVAAANNRNFKVCIPLRFILGFAEDYQKILLGGRQELTFTRARHDRNALVSPTAAEASTVTISRMSWVLPSVGVADKARISLLNVINKDIPISIPFRSWEYHENPAVSQTTDFTWTITSASQLERPRFIIFAFQTDRKDRYPAMSNRFDHVQVTNFKLFLNSESYPYSNLNLDFANNKYGAAYQMYSAFQTAYYNLFPPRPCVQYALFRTECPLFVIDCSKQNERMKITTTDIRLEVQTAAAIPANTVCHCIIIHDKIIEYTPLSNLVRKL